MTRWATWAIRNAVTAAALATWLSAPAFADDPVEEPASAEQAEAKADDGGDKAESSNEEGEEGRADTSDEAGHAKDGDADHSGDKSGGNAGHGGDAEGHGDDGHTEHEEDPYDLSHSNALPTQEKPEEWKFDLAIYTFVVFALLMGILLKFAWTPIMAALSDREQRVAKLIEDAEQSAATAQKQLAAYEAKLADAHSEAEGIVARAKDAAQEQADKIMSEAKESAEREKTRALAEIEQAKNEALGEVTQKSVDIALGLAKSVVGREINADDHSALIEEALAKFPS